MPQYTMEHLPPWLRDLPLPACPPSRQRSGAEGASAPQMEAVEQPESTATDSFEFSPEAAPDTTPIGSGVSGGETVIPDWLRDLQGELDETAADLPAVARRAPASARLSQSLKKPTGATDLLRSMGLEEAKASFEPPKASPTASMEAGIGKAKREEPLLDSSLDWLHDVTPEELERDIQQIEDPPSAPAKLPARQPHLDSHSLDFLGADIGPPTGTGQLIPSWLSDDSEPEPPVEELLDKPSWLQAGSAPAKEAPSAKRPSASDFPSWLQSTPEASKPKAASSSTTTSDVPSWLRSAPEESEAQAGVSLSNTISEPTIHEPEIKADVPSWLQGREEKAPSAPFLPPGPVSQPPIDEGPFEVEMPSWLQAEPQSSPPSSSPPSTTSDVPSWLQAEEVPSRASGTEASQKSLTVSDGVPSWLQNQAEEPVAPPPRFTGFNKAMVSTGIPDWLQEEPAREAQANPFQPSTVSDDLPNWLVGEASASAPSEHKSSPSASSAGAPPASISSDLPPWLAEEAPASAASAVGDAKLPAWLRGAENPPSPFEPALASPAPGPPGETQSEPPSQASRLGNKGLMSVGGGFFLGNTDLPSWLQQPENSALAAAQEAHSKGPSWKVIGISTPEEELELEIKPAVVLPRPKFELSQAHQEAASLLQKLAEQPFQEGAAFPALAQPRSKRGPGLEWFLAILFVAVLLAALLLPQFTSTWNQWLVGKPSSLLLPPKQKLAKKIAALSAKDVVLLAYEWDAQRSSELKPLEKALLQHLTERKVGIIFISTDPQGTLLSFEAREALKNAGYGGKGKDYLLLGYKPGGPLALRSLAQDLRATLSSDFLGQDATVSPLALNSAGKPRLKTLTDLAMIVVLADQPQDVENWQEQVHRSAPKVPMVLLLPAEVALVVQPYLHNPSQNIFALVGRQGALAYAAARQEDQEDSPAAAELTTFTRQQSLAIFTFVTLIFFGSGIRFLGQVFQRRSPKA